MTTMQHAEDLFESAPAAWRRPGVVFVVYAYRFLVAFVVALPVALLFGSAVGGYPRADAVLFDDGAMMFAEVMRRSNNALPMLATTAMVVLAIASFAGIMPLAALIGALSTKGRLHARDVGALALRPIAPFALLFGASTLTQAIVFGIFSALGRAIARRPAFEDPTSDRIKWGVTIFALCLVAIVGVVHDLARVAVVRDELRFRDAVRRAFRTLKSSHVYVLGAWAIRALLGAVAIYAALSIGQRLGVESTGKVVFGFLVYQASIILALFLKASWFASAMRHVDRARPVVVPEALEPVTSIAASSVDEPSSTEVAATNSVPESVEPDLPLPENSGTSDNLDAQA